MKKTLVLAIAALSLSAVGAQAAGDAAKGEKVFKKCQACHAVGDGAKNKVGPALNGIVGSKIGTHPEDFAFSKALKEKGEAGETWTEDNLKAWLESPKDFAKGTKMAFAGLKKEQDIEDVIAYLEQFK
ncbi:Cytochrome c2 [Hartmannibacter diazotrophicus]|uniref:Cytochrome c2 n=2 Tax=Hartmannibacter diazotrophicus TaxID=1482074 RepID=A0A2C9D4A8_9HYPH|nr:cytochrome c family protein [Hartmannibacter diazotrophicus]SON55019.1 Cytochrome c2 [Hartmannibacter diazotrophicus]